MSVPEAMGAEAAPGTTALTPAPLTPTPLAPIALGDLRRQAEPWQGRVDQPIAGLPSLTPVRGDLRLRHHGQLLEVEGRVETIVTLCCDRCLQHYNHPLRAEVRELLEVGPTGSGGEPVLEGLEGHVALELAAGADPELSESVALDLQERLDPDGRFDPERWLFEQLSLQLPVVNRCGAECPGPERWSSDGSSPTDPPTDPRWAALRHLQAD